MSAPAVLSTRKTYGVAGQYALTARVQYDGEEPSDVTFVTTTYGAPLIIQTGGIQTFIDSTVLDRIGRELTPEWVARFFAG